MLGLCLILLLSASTTYCLSNVRFVSITAASATGQTRLEIAEVQVFSSSATNIARRLSPTCAGGFRYADSSSGCANGLASHTTDDDTCSYAQCLSGAFVVDLGAATAVTNVQVIGRTAGYWGDNWNWRNNGATVLLLDSASTVLWSGAFTSPCRYDPYISSPGYYAGTTCSTTTFTLLSSILQCNAGSYTSGSGVTAACVLCPAGQYQDLQNAVSCKSCNPGEGLTAGAAACVSCTPGMFSPAVGSPCLNCAAGQYSTGSGASSCLTCSAGTFSASGSASCQQCPAGTAQSQAGSSACLPCAPGSIAPFLGTSSCALCPAGFSSSADSLTCTACAPGRFAASVGSATCTPCIASQYQPLAGQAFCLTCPAGNGSAVPGLATCTPCRAGQTSAAGLCYNCTAGRYSAVPGAVQCIACAPNTYSPISGLTACLSCPASNVSSGGCSYCSDPSLSAAGGNCPGGTYHTGLGGSAECAPCPSGTYTSCGDALDSSYCTRCDPGTFSATGSASCTPCSVGRYATTPPSGMCQNCSAGTQSSTLQATSSAVCALCAAGRYSGSAASTCSACPPGKSTVGTSGAATCTLCIPGFFSDAQGSGQCLPCNPGKAAGEMGSTACTLCAAGTFANSASTTQCQLCGAGSYSSAIGAPSDSFCSKCTDIAPNLFSTALGATSSSRCAPCPAISGNMTRNDNGRQCVPCDAGYWCDGRQRQLPCFGDPSNCLGPRGCAPGYTDMACSSCAAGYREAARSPATQAQAANLQCKPCLNNTALYIGLLILAVTLLAVFYFALLSCEWYTVYQFAYKSMHQNFTLPQHLQLRRVPFLVQGRPCAGCYICVYNVCRRHNKVMRRHAPFNFLVSKQMQMLATLYAATSLPYPASFRDFFLGIFNGIPIPWHVDCLKQGSSWTFADSFTLRASLLSIALLLIPVDVFLIRETDEGDEDPVYAASKGGERPLKGRCCCLDLWAECIVERRRWLVNTQQGTKDGYDHSLYSSQYLKFAADNFLNYAFMAFVYAEPTEGGAGTIFYDSRLSWLSGSGLHYQAFAAAFVALYVLAGMWFFVIPVIASFTEAPWACGCLKGLGEFCARNLILRRRGQKQYADGVVPPPELPPSARLGFFNLAQLGATLFTSVAVLVPTNNRAMTSTLLVISLLELLSYLLQLLHCRLTAPFSLTGEVAIYLAQLLLAVFTHAVAVSCAAQQCRPQDLAWQPIGIALIVLHSIFFTSFAAYLARLVLWDHSRSCKQCNGQGLNVLSSGIP